ncbi:MAG: hypothetical protein J6X54_04915 [Treponema sp.]|nr:hypothetical protein [Treponema sp.]
MNLYQTIESLENTCPDSLCKSKENIKYPVAEHVKYYSNTCKMDRWFNILLPPDYDSSKKYPVCYALHGIMCNEFMFLQKENSLEQIFTNLIEQKLTKEMIVVFPDIFARTDPALEQSFTIPVFKAYDNFINELTDDLMPYIQKNYSVLTGKENTALVGFSMGGREAIYIGLTRPDLFDYIGAISPAPGLLPSKDKFAEHYGMFTPQTFEYQKDDKAKFFMICTGDDDKVVVHFPKSYHDELIKNNVEHLFFEVKGADHNEIAIKSGLYHFWQAAFK